MMKEGTAAAVEKRDQQQNSGVRVSRRFQTLKWAGRSYVVGITILAIILIISPAQMDRVRYALTQNPFVFAGYAGQVVAHKSQHSRADTLVVLGDSISRGVDTRAVYDGPAVNFGIGGDTLHGVSQRVATYDLEQTRKVLVLCGVNDMARYSDTEIIANYKTVLDDLKGKDILVCAVLPLNEARFRPAYVTYINGNKVNNARISGFNQLLDKLAQSYANVRFCNAGPLLADAAGGLRADLTADGIHPNKEGYRILQTYLKAQLSEVKRGAM